MTPENFRHHQAVAGPGHVGYKGMGTGARGPRVLAPALARLSRARLFGLPDSVRLPLFDPAGLRPGILHLGCGSFHRAHQAWLTQCAIEAEMAALDAVGHATGRSDKAAVPAWGIVAASLRTPEIIRALQPQDGLYSVLEQGPCATRVCVVGSLCQLIYGPRQAMALQRAFADPQIRIVTLTVTAGGYLIDPTTGRLDTADPAVQADLRPGAVPATAIGVLVHGLRARRAAGLPPPVVLSCDNLPQNGAMLRQACLDFSALRDDTLAGWVASNVQFPSTMVDRIVPSTSDADRSDAQAALGLIDAAPVPSEPFSQWVIERFDGPRPLWEAAGAQFVDDVAPWEASKLRLLNGGHLALACLGLLAGCTTVAEAMAVPGFGAFMLRFMLAEQMPTLPPSDHDIDAYARQLLARWRNHRIAHRLQRVARDGSSKLASRLLSSIVDNHAAGRPTPCTTLAVAAWLRCCEGLDDHGRPVQLEDHLADRLAATANAARGSTEALVDAMLAQGDVFGRLADDRSFRDDLVVAVDQLRLRGARGAVAACLAGAAHA
ncbi:MAG: hypothetical protein JWQ88_2988 [Rhodoferax sp.]|nr:hypothetical protein [Rhodoferax sp.]